MKRRSPTLEGFQVLFRQPALGLAEIAWRWSFSLAVAASLVYSVGQYLATLPVTSVEMFLLRTRQPALILQALTRIFQGSGPRAVAAAVVLTLALALGWIVLASLGRAATLKVLFGYFRKNSEPGDSALNATAFQEARPVWRLPSLVGLNCLRAGVTLAALVSATLGALLLAAASSSKTDPSPARALLIFFVLTMLMGLAWTILNWLLSLAEVFVVGKGLDAFSALVSAVNLCRTHPGPLAAAATCFGMIHLLAFTIATSVVGLPLGFAGVLPGGAVLGGVLMVTLLYFAIVDFLHIGRLAAYVCIVDQPPAGTQPSAVGPQPSSGFPPSGLPSPSDDDILSDIPGLVPPSPEPLGS
jgi:hypothetical protein